VAREELAPGRRIAHAYTVEALPAELVEPSAVG
jgi:hypothetical protein